MDPKLITGTVDLLLLEVISAGQTYGYEITQQVLKRSKGKLELNEGSLYPALHRLERQKLLAVTWQEVEGRRRKYYRVTAAGRRVLAEKRSDWMEFVSAVQGVLGAQYGMA